ncbi:MAG: hypothetical protein H6Q89_5397 [Myxococcaceae bacterium]|nr:hypothetical protein [Myxococcaceae bacterium]
MTTELMRAAHRFRDAYHARADLVSEQGDWSRTIALVAMDTGDAVAVRIAAGRIVECLDRSTTGDVVITADAKTLCDILELRQSPNAPYLFGDLVVRGPEADFLRLDYLATRLCPE